MRQWPEYALETVASVVAPTLRRRPDAGEIAAMLDRLARPTAERLTDLALRWHMKPMALKMRLSRAGVRKVSSGPHGEGIYRMKDVEQVMKKGECND